MFNIIIVWFLCALLDYGTGVLSALKNKKLKSSKMRAGLYTKFSDTCVIIATLLLCKLVSYLKIEGLNVYYIKTVIVGVMSLKELLSILENCYTMGSKIPKTLSKILEICESEVGNDEK